MKLTEQQREEFLANVQKVLETLEDWTDQNAHYPAETVIDAVLTIPEMKKGFGGQDGEGFDTNGWQWDWWQTFDYKGKKFVLGGCGYYGSLSFTYSEGDDDEEDEE